MDFVHERVPDSAMIPDSASAMVRSFAILPCRWSGPKTWGAFYYNYQTDLKLFISPNFTNLRSLHLRLHAFGRWPVDRRFEQDSWEPSAEALSLPEWKDAANVLLSRDQPPQISVVVWLIGTTIANWWPEVVRHFCYLAERKEGTVDEVELKYIRRLCADGCFDFPLTLQDLTDGWDERSWEPNQSHGYRGCPRATLR